MTGTAPIRGAPALVDRDEVAVLFLRVADELPAMRRAWADLEARIGPLRGRRFYGAFDERAAEYRVCVVRRDGDDPAALGLEEGALAGGRYVRVRLRGEPPGVYDLIAPTFDELARHVEADPGRPALEFYRGRDEIDLLLPVAPGVAIGPAATLGAWKAEDSDSRSGATPRT